LTAETSIDPELEAFLNGNRPPTRADFKGMGFNFKATVQELGNVTENLMLKIYKILVAN